MGLSCGCDSWGDDAEWWFTEGPFSPLDTKRSRKCCSCKDRVSVGAECLELQRWRSVNEDHDVEYRIYGDEFPLASWYLCERCAGIYLSLEELGFCVDLSESMESQLAEYHRDYAKRPAPGFELKLKRREGE